MKIKQMAERLNSVPVRKKAKQILAVTLAVLMVNPVTGYGITAHAQESETITAFAKLSSEIATQQLAVGAEESDINLPDTLSVTLSVYGGDTTESIVEDSQPEEIPAESTSEEPAVDETPADDSTVSDNDAEEPQDDENGAEDNTATDSEATVVLDSGEVPLAASTTGSAISADLDDADTEQTKTETITTEERTLTGITWQINAERSGSDTFNSESAGAVFFYEPVLPEGYTLADGVSLPQIQVQIEDNSKWTFSQSQTIDGIEITVKAEKDVFPEGAVLHVEKITSTEDKAKIQSAVSEEVQSVDTAKTVTELVSFDITITDADGNELQPDTSKGEVKVSFAQLPMVTQEAAPTQELKVFHMDDTLSEAKGLDTTVDQVAETVEATAEHFSVYTVAQLTDEIRANVEAEIKASDDTLTYYDTIEEAFTAAQSMDGCTVKLLKDVSTENAVNLTKGTFSFDLNGKAWSNTYLSGSGVLQLNGTDGKVSLTIKDSAGGGKITTTASNCFSVFRYSNSSLTLEGGNYPNGIWTVPYDVGELLADGCAYKNNDNGEWITDTSVNKVTNVTVAKAPMEFFSIELKTAGGETTGFNSMIKAVTAAAVLEDAVITLKKDVSVNETLLIEGGKFAIDLNGHSITFSDNNGRVAIKSGVNITFIDSAGTGKISNSGKYAPTLYIFGGAVVKLTGGSYENRNSEGKSITFDDSRKIGDILAEGYIYRSLSDNSYISNTNAGDIGSVKVVPAPVKITNQPQDIVVQSDYTEFPKFSLGAAKTGTENFTCQWYSVGTGAGGADEALTGENLAMLAIETGKSAGQYKYYCELTCEDYKVRTNTVSLYVIDGNGAAKLHEADGTATAYPTVETAINQAKTKSGSTVKLMENISTAETIELSEGEFAIDLNGKTWTAAKTALYIKSGGNVTLKDSAGGGVLQSDAYGLVQVKNTSAGNQAILNIESGSYKNTSSSMGCVIYCNNTLHWSNDRSVINISGGEISVKANGYASYFTNATVNISGGSFLGNNYFNKSVVSLSGGELGAVRNNGGSVASLLKEGYGFRTIDSRSSDNGKWVNQTEGAANHANDLAHVSLTYNTRVEPLPLEIKTQPTAPQSVVYGYTEDEAPNIRMYAEKTVYAPTGSAVSYSLWRVKEGSETTDTKIGDTDLANIKKLPTALGGAHQFYMTAECDGKILRSNTVTFHVEKATPTITLSVITREEAPFVYGERIYFRAEVNGMNGEKPTGTVTFKMDGQELRVVNDISYGFYQTGDGDVVDAGTHSFTAVYTPSTDGTGKNYVTATSSAVSKTIAKANLQDFAITGVTGKKYGDAPFNLEATSTGVPVDAIFSVPENNNVLSLSGNTATIIGAGTVTVTATKAADNNFNEATAIQSITIEKADTSIAFNSSYTGNFYYTGSPISNPVEADLSITGAGYSNVVLTWYDQTNTKLDTPPTLPGSYILAVSIPENDLFKPSSNTKSITISPYDGAVTFAYNGSTTKEDWYSADVAITADGYTVSDSEDGTFVSSYLLSGEGEVSDMLYFKENGTGFITDGKPISVSIDKTAPVFSADTDGITISDNNWKGFLNNITFGHFFKENKDVSILAADSGSGVNKYYYYIDYSGKTAVKTADELNAISFVEGASFSITDENQYIIYAYAVDLAGNKSAYICTDGIVIDKTAPTVTLTAPTGSDLGDVSGAAKVKMDETGIISYIIKTTEQSGITAQNILDSTEKNTVSVTDGQADTNIDVELSGLTANTTYYIYAMGTDSAQNNSSVVSTSFTTTTTQPVFSENPTITGTYGQQVKDMTVSQVASTNGVAGSWSVSSTDKPSVGTTTTYEVVFTPDDAVQHATVTVQVTPTVNPRSLTAAGVTIGEVTGTYTYDGTAKVPTVIVADSTATITASDYDYSYSQNIDAGTATVTVTAKGNYAGNVSRTFMIDKAPAPSITYPTASGITYGQKLSASALSFSSNEYGTFAWTNGNVVPTVSNSGYEVTFTPNANTTANYEAITGTTHTVAITVSKATPAVTVNAVVSDDAGSRKATLTATVTGAGDGEIPTGTVKFVNSTSGSDVDIAGATAVTITGGKATYTWTGLAKQIYKVKAVYNDSANYNTATSTELSFDTNKQNQVALNIGSIGTKTYGDGTFTLSATGGSGGGAVTFESSDPTIVSISGTTAMIHKAGTVTITATKAADSAYNEATASVSLTVGKKALTVKANDQLNIIKGVAMPVLTYTATGLVGSDTFTSPTVSVAAADTNTVGEYDIMINGGTLTNADSYAVSYTNGKLTVVNATYNVTVTYGTGDGNYSEGQTVTITADSRSGYTFTGWSSSDGVTFANSTASTTTFVMPAKAVTVTANYSKNSSGDNGNTNGGSTSNNNNDTTNQNTTNNGSTTDNTSTTGTGTNQTVKETTQGGKVQQTDNLGRTEENQPYLSGDKGKSGWDAIITEVDESIDEEATEPVPLTVEMNGATIIPANVISQLRGKNVKLILNMGNGITWTINGMDVEDTELSDIDLGVTRNTSVIPEDVVNGIRGENSSIQIELAHKGAFGFTATLSIAFDSTDAGKYANLFYYNEETGKLEYMESAQVSEDGTATLTFVHASAYSIVLSSAQMDESSITASESRGNNQANDNSKTVTTQVQATDETSGSMMVIWILLGVIVVVVVAGTTIYMKKKKDDKEENEA